MLLTPVVALFSCGLLVDTCDSELNLLALLMIYIRTLCNLDLSLSLSCGGTCFSQDKQIMNAFSSSCRDRIRNETTCVECNYTGRDQWGKTAMVDIFFVIDTLLQCCPSPWSTKI
jgi:hypothetical protein